MHNRQQFKTEYIDLYALPRKNPTIRVVGTIRELAGDIQKGVSNYICLSKSFGNFHTQGSCSTSHHGLAF